MEESHNLLPGFVFARDFRITRKIGEGGMGAVYEAEQLSTSKTRALKLMHASMACDSRLRDRFVQEAHAVAQIESDHIAEVVAAGVDETSGIPWLAMEFLRGETLEAFVKNAGPLSPRDLLELAVQMKHALSQAHGRGIVHRDLKPENLFVSKPRRAGIAFTLKVLDFGIAKWVQETREVPKAPSVANSQVLGSPLWMAPEQWQPNAPIGPATDVWALALVMFFALTSELYWLTATSGDIGRIVVEVMTERLAPPSERARQRGSTAVIVPGFDEWFLSCLDRNPKQRPRDANVALSAFEELFEGPQKSLRPVIFRDAGLRPPAHPSEADVHTLPTAPQQAASVDEKITGGGPPRKRAGPETPPGSASARVLWRLVSGPLAAHVAANRVLASLTPAVTEALSVEPILVGLTEDRKLDRIAARSATSEHQAYDRAAAVMRQVAIVLTLSRPSIYALESAADPIRVEPTVPLSWVIGPKIALATPQAATFLSATLAALGKPELHLRTIAEDAAQLRRIIASALEIARKSGSKTARDMTTSVLRSHVVAGSEVAARLLAEGDLCTEEALAGWRTAVDLTIARVGLLAAGNLSAADEALRFYPTLFGSSSPDVVLSDLGAWTLSNEYAESRLLWGPLVV